MKLAKEVEKELKDDILLNTYAGEVQKHLIYLVYEVKARLFGKVNIEEIVKSLGLKQEEVIE